MGKKRWVRTTLHDLASREMQERVLGVLEPDNPEKRPSETPEVEQQQRTLASTLRPGESV